MSTVPDVKLPKDKSPLPVFVGGVAKVVDVKLKTSSVASYREIFIRAMHRSFQMELVGRSLLLPTVSRPFLRPKMGSFPPRVASTSSVFTWEDAFNAASDGGGGNLRGFFQKVRNCNRGMEKRSEFVPFRVECETVGYVHRSFASHLMKFDDVFSFARHENDPHSCSSVELLQTLASPEDRTAAVAHVIKELGTLIPGIRNELYPVTSSYSAPAYFSMERAAAPYFGIKAYGVHMNGYAEKDGQIFLWVGKRSNMKPTYPGMLDHLVAGGLPHGISCKENLLKECEEEAGIPRSISKNAIPVGAVTYMDIEGNRYKRDVLFCYDLKLPVDFSPENVDGEVESFRLIPITKVASIIEKTDFFKPNCSLVIIDFLFRHGYIEPDSQGYLELLQSLRSGICS